MSGPFVNRERVDHTAEALSLLVRAGKQGADDLGADLRLEALVHAQLAVAEQQRISNLIASFSYQHMPALVRAEVDRALGFES